MHKLDETLQHWGVKGMRWDVKRTPEEIKEDAANNVDALGEELEDAGDEVAGNDSILDAYEDMLDAVLFKTGDVEKQRAKLKDAVKDKAEDVASDVKKTGKRIVDLFGKTFAVTSTTSYTSTGSGGGTHVTSSVTRDLFGRKIKPRKKTLLPKKIAPKKTVAKKSAPKKKKKSVLDIYLPAKDR